MDLTVIANWAQIVGALQQVPSTIVALRELFRGRQESEMAEGLSQTLVALMKSFDVLEELKDWHDHSQSIFNIYSKIYSQTSGGAATIQMDYFGRTWRSIKTTEFATFFTRMASFKHITPLVSAADVQKLKSGVDDLDLAVRQMNLTGITDCADVLQHDLVSFLTKADSALKQAIHELYDGVAGAERGLRV